MGIIKGVPLKMYITSSFICKVTKKTKRIVKQHIRKVLVNRTTVRLTGEYLLKSDEVVVDDDDDDGDDDDDEGDYNND